MSSSPVSPAGESLSSRKKTLIIGAGPTGLGAAWRLEELASQGVVGAEDWLLVDAASGPGGLSCSIRDDQGFVWDMGGHVIFSHYKYFTDLLSYLIPSYNNLQREAWVWMRNRFIAYPFQQNMHRLPHQDTLKCLQGLIEIERKRGNFQKPQNFKEWLEQSFGSGLCEVFMFPYNKKVWAYNPDQMNVEWMGERVATVDINKILKNLVLQEDELGWGPNSTFRFPVYGGTGSIYTALYNTLPPHKFVFNKKVVDIDVDNKCVYFNDGTYQEYENVISTMPLDNLCKITRNLKGYTHEVLIEKSMQFKYSSSHIIGFGLAGKTPPHLSTKCWMYFPEDDCPFYRATIFSNYSENNVPKPGQQWSIMCEVSESPSKPVDVKTVVEMTEKGLINTKLISESDIIVSRFHIRLEYGYPTPFYGRDALCTPLFDAYEREGVYSRGRFGAWKYEVSNQDHSLMQGVECADHILLGTEETTVRFPSIVNSKTNAAGRTPFFKHVKQPPPHKQAHPQELKEEESTTSAKTS